MGSFDQISKRAAADGVQDYGPAGLSADIENMRRQDGSNAKANDTVFSASSKTESAKLFEQTHLPPIELTGLSGYASGSEFLTATTNNALRKSFYSGDGNADSQKFYSTFPDPKHDLASAWDMGEVLEATLSTAQLSHNSSASHELEQDLTVLSHYWDQKSRTPGFDSEYGPHGDKYYDDNAWIGIALLDAYKQNANSSDLAKAIQIFELEKIGTQGTDKLAHPGGVFWTQQAHNFYRATVSTAGAAQLALELYQQTHDQQYLQFATRQFNWVNDNLRAPDGLYYDGMDKDGTVHKQEYTYNQGLMLGDATLLFQATGDRKYLQQAQEIAKASLQNFGERNATARDTGDTPSPFSKQLTFFNAVFFKNLMLLDSVAPDRTYRQALADYSAELAKRLDPQTGLVKVDGKNTLLDQASAVQVFALAEEEIRRRNFNLYEVKALTNLAQLSVSLARNPPEQ